ncbi:MAG: hypothetical protein ABSF43_13805 [Rectinemataceae bacterium]|jgi:hypothetical protein
MRRKRSTILAISLPIIALICFSACSPKAPASTIVGSWKTESEGMTWQWSFARDGSFAWRVLGQTDMGGKPVEIDGEGHYAVSAMTLSLSFEKFPGVPGILRSGDAAPGFNARTEVKLRFAGVSRMFWTFDSAALGTQESSLARIE